MKLWLQLLLAVPMLCLVAVGYKLDPNDPSSVKTVARSLAEDLMSFYKGDQPGHVPGLLPDPYYWWEGGALMGAMIDYWYYTGDDKWNKAVIQGLMHQVGQRRDYIPDNQTLTEGNDDQGFWGLAVMAAAEQNFPDPPPNKPQYLALAQAVFNTQAARWDETNCGGGLRWQIFTWNKGYDYKNTISQGCFFALAARLALYTGNQSYAEWAERTWDWTVDIGFIDHKYWVYDGAHIPDCTNRVPYQWSYNAGVFINGASAMYNLTGGSDKWRERLEGLVKGADVFFTGPNKDIMHEVACEEVELCDLDQQSFKAYLSRWMAAATKWAPFLSERLLSKLRPSSVAAAAQCKGGDNGRMCGLKWTKDGEWDGQKGVGQQMMAMQAVLSNLVTERPDPVTENDGGTSKGDPAAGGSDMGRSDPMEGLIPKARLADKAGAVVLTFFLLVTFVMMIVWMCMDEMSDKSLKQRFSDFRRAFRTRPMPAIFVRSKTRTRDEKGKGVQRQPESDRGSPLVDSGTRPVAEDNDGPAPQPGERSIHPASSASFHEKRPEEYEKIKGTKRVVVAEREVSVASSSGSWRYNDNAISSASGGPSTSAHLRSDQ